MPKHYRPPGKKKEGNVAKYITRNKALNRLQLKLAEFRRLCILKGIHPREPKKKFEGHNKTYYHVKDINFLAHEPLLEKSREIKVHEKKIKKAKAKLNRDLAERLERNLPSFSLDHLVKERYPSFIDALRDMDDPLTMIHLFATLPADRTHKIPVERVHSCRRLSLEWQAFVTRTHSLRKVFISVKGIYYQVEVAGQKITWLTPHVLSQVLPDDVDFRVMLTFVEFYEVLTGFVNFKLYHSIGLKYPPLLNADLEQAAAELYGMMRGLVNEAQLQTDNNESTKPEKDDLVKSVIEDVEFGEREQRLKEKEQRLKESQARLASLQDRLVKMEKDRAGINTETDDSHNGSAIIEKEDTVEEEEDEETKLCKGLFKDLKFYLSREVPRESLLFVIRGFGGSVSWDGRGAPYEESDDSITHQVVDRPTQGHMFLSRDYIQPQWVYDCANSRILLPVDEYLVGRIPPPHLSPFVNNEAEGHVPEYAEAIKRLQSAARNHLLPLPGTDEPEFEAQQSFLASTVARHSEHAEAAAREIEAAAVERAYMDDLSKELSGITYSASLQVDTDVSDDKTEEEGHVVVPKDVPNEAVDDTAMAQMMMTRKSRKLYEAMQMGKSKKRADIELLKRRKREAEEKGLSAKKSKRV
ncbi:hypothetical protein O6H91_17G030700 [Diphasiastrum complanatum]|uniref:Uncharacterized protein n=5 Tax=Diphasiastrum complanatum TaxID=34168 RepID=A0ACC2B5H7_DIPCM|nr:hypothetical protein O6H91_17G030700 [Diphasiastrum complanatum]KAJ7524978.1 hypothetical protein O6H91_17G030700 [Diphasiastrum complanatum]KAJ7524979.1 hypothetical protein O6H91_17G030700 [Diphasiastrum complanatum]KAJ7524981.1 hypothetical protein O6H91_17G030700 [Diphasiastrum complanatum]KAJ7524982.1 hypothetical protein O6H91_17G030700 [Diphasiastrum complanatum]